LRGDGMGFASKCREEVVIVLIVVADSRLTSSMGYCPDQHFSGVCHSRSSRNNRGA
jgi:hypothetical protein